MYKVIVCQFVFIPLRPNESEITTSLSHVLTECEKTI